MFTVLNFLTCGAIQIYRFSYTCMWQTWTVPCVNCVWSCRMEALVESSESDSEKSSESEEEPGEDDVALEAYISKASVEDNYKLMEKTVTPEKSPLVLSELRLAHSEAFSPESETALAAAVDDLSLPFPLSDFQTFSVNCLLNKKDLLCVMPTGERCIFLIQSTVKECWILHYNWAFWEMYTRAPGSGKTLVMYLFATALRPEALPIIFGLRYQSQISFVRVKSESNQDQRSAYSRHKSISRQKCG